MLVTKDNSEYQKAYEAFAKGGEKLESFTGVARNGESGGFNAGDVIEFPDVIKPIKIPIGNSGYTAEFIVVRITDVKKRSRFAQFFPSQLSKRIYEVEVDSSGKYVKDKDVINPDGEAAEMYRSMAGQPIDDVLKVMAEKGDIIISKVEPVKVCAYGTKNVTTTRKYTFDFA